MPWKGGRGLETNKTTTKTWDLFQFIPSTLTLIKCTNNTLASRNRVTCLWSVSRGAGNRAVQLSQQCLWQAVRWVSPWLLELPWLQAVSGKTLNFWLPRVWLSTNMPPHPTISCLLHTRGPRAAVSDASSYAYYSPIYSAAYSAICPLLPTLLSILLPALLSTLLSALLPTLLSALLKTLLTILLSILLLTLLSVLCCLLCFLFSYLLCCLLCYLLCCLLCCLLC